MRAIGAGRRWPRTISRRALTSARSSATSAARSSASAFHASTAPSRAVTCDVGVRRGGAARRRGRRARGGLAAQLSGGTLVGEAAVEQLFSLPQQGDVLLGEEAVAGPVGGGRVLGEQLGEALHVDAQGRRLDRDHAPSLTGPIQ